MDILVTKRLTLRPPLEVDADEITKLLANTNVSRMLTRVPNPYQFEDAKAWIESIRDQTCSLYFTIHRQNLAGVISIEANESGSPDLGYWLGEPYWGNGYMSEAARAVVSHGFKALGCGTLKSGAYEDNPASAKVLQNLGFEPAGTANHFNSTRKCDVLCNRLHLTREAFERRFGPLDNREAA